MSQKIKKLVAQLTEYNEAYRAGNAIITDSSYDNLKAQLVDLDPNHPFLLEVEPTPVKSGAEVRHKIPMLSLAKAFIGDGKLEKYVERVNKAAKELNVTTKFLYLYLFNAKFFQLLEMLDRVDAAGLARYL